MYTVAMTSARLGVLKHSALDACARIWPVGVLFGCKVDGVCEGKLSFSLQILLL